MVSADVAVRFRCRSHVPLILLGDFMADLSNVKELASKKGFRVDFAYRKWMLIHTSGERMRFETLDATYKFLQGW